MGNEPQQKLPRKAPESTPAPKGAASRMKSELAGLTFDEQQAKVQPPEPATRKLEKA